MRLGRPGIVRDAPRSRVLHERLTASRLPWRGICLEASTSRSKGLKIRKTFASGAAAEQAPVLPARTRAASQTGRPVQEKEAFALM
jgi:hypothetical protein